MSRDIRFRAWDKGTEGAEPQGMSYNQEFCHVMIRNNDGFEIMQYTGLKDKTGKEIYEGDVVSLPNRYDGDYRLAARISEVVWDDEGWYVSGKGECHWSQMEVIGNIWQNPELLNPNK